MRIEFSDVRHVRAHFECAPQAAGDGVEQRRQPEALRDQAQHGGDHSQREHRQPPARHERRTIRHAAAAALCGGGLRARGMRVAAGLVGIKAALVGRRPRRMCEDRLRLKKDLFSFCWPSGGRAVFAGLGGRVFWRLLGGARSESRRRAHSSLAAAGTMADAARKACAAAKSPSCGSTCSVYSSHTRMYDASGMACSGRAPAAAPVRRAAASPATPRRTRARPERRAA
ncbi:hypothetical protein BX661DRAFT_85482 [Kickxella alabastrina]|uniref:uncharacterized protein n=1 Tax=Kickxella alabastrina TaxID=61397 RepID=UPI00221EECF5|nr:uncharacterized protein BX661DRAFT_85482 [Kickxella alabastrina]KAI7831897.1 hypothetical protein BX661DRAFT_85482 [Kickxella alabastrina]